MGLIGNLTGLLAGGTRYVPPAQPPQQTNGTGDAQSTSAPPSTGQTAPEPAAGAAPPPQPSAVNGTNASTTVQPSRNAPASAALSVPRQGTPADASPTRSEFGLAAPQPDEESARAYAVAAQARERLQGLVDGLAAAPDSAPALPAARAERPEPPGGAGINATLPTLRGKEEPGAILDKVA
jgi:hypothetical protein